MAKKASSKKKDLRYVGSFVRNDTHRTCRVYAPKSNEAAVHLSTAESAGRPAGEVFGLFNKGDVRKIRKALHARGFTVAAAAERRVLVS